MRTEHLAEGVTLYCGDCREILPGLGPVDAVVTDPPYGNRNHDGDLNSRLNDYRGIANQPIANDGADEMRDVVDAMLTAVVTLLPKKASACCCFCGGGGAFAGVCVACRAHGQGRTRILPFGHMGQEKPRPRPSVSEAA